MIILYFILIIYDGAGGVLLLLASSTERKAEEDRGEEYANNHYTHIRILLYIYSYLTATASWLLAVVNNIALYNIKRIMHHALIYILYVIILFKN